MPLRGKQMLPTILATLACVALAAGLVFARGGGHGGRHHGAHHHHGSHGDHHANHHRGGRGGWDGYGWSAPVGGWNNYAYDQPISVPISGFDSENSGQANYNDDGPSAGSNRQVAQNDDSDEMADDDSDNGEGEEDDIDYRGAIQLALPNKDAHVFLNGKLVFGVGTRRLLLTPEIEEENKPEKFHVLAVWEENGRPQQREADVEITAGGGIALNLTTAKPTESALPSGAPKARRTPAETAEAEAKSNESIPADSEQATH